MSKNAMKWIKYFLSGIEWCYSLPLLNWHISSESEMVFRSQVYCHDWVNFTLIYYSICIVLRDSSTDCTVDISQRIEINFLVCTISCADKYRPHSVWKWCSNKTNLSFFVFASVTSKNLSILNFTSKFYESVHILQ